MTQPVWKIIANLGDVHPLEHGGFFIYKDETGVYTEEAERYDADIREVHRITLDRCTLSYDGVLSDNPHHPDLAAWFADSLPDVATSIGMEPTELRALLCSADPLERAEGYRAVLDHHGWANGDSYPLTLTRKEARERYQKDIEELDAR